MYFGGSYSNLIDEYATKSVIDCRMLSTPDIVTPDSDPPDSTLFHTVRQLSTPQGCRKWIRKQLLEHEHEFITSRSLTVFVATWNVNGKKPQVPLDSWLLVENLPPDLFVIGFQEVQPLSGISVMSTDDTRTAVWQEAVEKCIAKYGEDYGTICAKQMVGILLIILVKKRHCPFVQNVAVCDAGTGFMRTGGNKGAVGCRFRVYDRTLCCVTSHLAAHGHNLERRNQDFNDVVRKSLFRFDNPEISPFRYRYPDLEEKETDILVNDKNYQIHAESTFSSSIDSSTTFGILEHDVVLWTGDLNYRIDGLHPEGVVDLIEKQDWATLTKHDQLVNAMKCKEAFQGFEEMPLSFAPTYKYELFQNAYDRDGEDNTLKRTPAWTDRILWLDRINTDLALPKKQDINQSEEADVNEELNQFLPRASEPKQSDSKVITNENRPQCSTRTSLNVASVFKAENYRRHDLFSSDHRPVSARFTLEVSDLIVDKRNEVVNRVHSSLRKKCNLLRPRFSLSATVIDLGLVEFLKPAVCAVPLVVCNLGYIPFSLRVGIENTPSWLQILCDTDTEVQPLESCTVRFRVLLKSGSRFLLRLNTGLEKLRTFVPISIQGKIEASISIIGQYSPTAYGTSISHLTAHPKPFLLNPRSPRTAINILRELAVPKEIHLLVSHLLRGCVKSDGYYSGTDSCALHTNRELFLCFLSQDNVQVSEVRKCIDMYCKIPDETPPIAVTSCMVGLLESLEDPVVPYRCYDAVLSLVRRGAFELNDLQFALQQNGARAPVFNTLVYLHALVNELAAVKECTFETASPDVIQILSTFCSLMLRPAEISDERCDVDLDDRLQFTKSMVSLCRQGAFPVIFDCRVSSGEL